MIEVKAKAMKATKDTPIDAVAIAGNLSLPQLEIQSSTLVKAEDEADSRRYANTCHSKDSTELQKTVQNFRFPN